MAQPVREMAEDLIRYDILAQDALRGVVRKVLSEVAKTGLPGEHHFYVTFSTRAPGVRVSSRLLAQYPETMTIVLQHQYWDLSVNDQAFEVGLSFNGIPERLLVPFTAVKAFVDPSVQFTLHFEPVSEALSEGEPEPGEPAVEAPEESESVPMPAAARAEGQPAQETQTKPPVTGDAQVVSLDAFRKKN